MTDTDGTNVLFVVLDTVRKDHLSVYGYEEPTTPRLAEFAEEAAVFENAVAPAPWTLPVHASLFTGLYPSEHGATQETPYLEGATTLAESLSAAGYDTACYPRTPGSPPTPTSPTASTTTTTSSRSCPANCSRARWRRSGRR